jgi:hypothetical protein
MRDVDPCAFEYAFAVPMNVVANSPAFGAVAGPTFA